MPTVDFGGCVANYWYVWSINSLGSVFGLAINMAVSYFFMKYFLNPANCAPKPSTPNSSSSQNSSNSQNSSSTHNSDHGNSSGRSSKV